MTELSAPNGAIEGIEVCAFPASFEEEEISVEDFGCAKTNVSGEYTIAGLGAGRKYDVEFAPAAGSGLNFVAEYYDGTYLLEDATPVSVTAGTTTAGIDAQLEAGGMIAGVVTRAAGGEPIAGVEVCAFSIVAESFGCATSEADGEYTIAGLREGVSYDVEFSSPPVGGLGYVTQYYDGRSKSTEAEAVQVKVRQTTSGIDASLEAGGFIAGRVTDASTGAPLDHALVCVLGMDGSVEPEQCAGTNTSGEYTSPTLAGGSYKVAFLAPKYVTQYYNDRASLALAEAVSVSPEETTSGINAALAPIAASGVKQPGPPRGALAVPPVAIPLASPAPPAPLAEIVAAKIVVTGHSARGVEVACLAATCRGSVELTMQLTVKHRKGGRTVAHRETLVLAKASFSIPVGGHAAVVLQLTAAGRRQLAHVKRHPLKARLTISVTGGSSEGQTALVR